MQLKSVHVTRTVAGRPVVINGVRRFSRPSLQPPAPFAVGFPRLGSHALSTVFMFSQ